MKKLFVTKTLNEYRAALVDNGEILDFLREVIPIDKENHPGVGDIYKGKVVKVLPGMQSSFIDIGYKKAAFLHIDDAYIYSIEEQREIAKLIESEKLSAERDKFSGGNIIYDEFSTISEVINMRLSKDINIEDILKEGQEVLVQVVKEPISTKGPRVTCHITLPGCYVVFMPLMEHIGVSRRIEDEKERERLKDLLSNICPGEKGVIARTVSEGQSYKTLKSDFNMLVKLWKDISKKAEQTNKLPNLCYKDLNFIQRLFRDIIDEGIEEIYIDDKESLKQAEKFIEHYLPSMKGKCVYYEKKTPLFEKHDIDMEIKRALNDNVYLRSGGSLNIDQTEALVSIDVNTGKYVGRNNYEETILHTNLEAVKEISYQLRLRNCGGIIIIDFIDMEKEDHRNQVYESLIEALKKDRAKTSVLPISTLGLVEMTRKRTRDTLVRAMCTPCPYCEGMGRIKSTKTICYELIRETIKLVKQISEQKVYIYAHPEVIEQLCSEDLNIIEHLEETYKKSLIIRSENNYHIEQFDILT